MLKQKKIRLIDRGERDKEKSSNRERERAALMICDAFTTATCSSLVYHNKKRKKTQTHTDEPRLQTASIWEENSSIGKHNRLQSETVDADVGVASTGGVSTLLHHQTASRCSRQLSALCMCFFIIQVKR